MITVTLDDRQQEAISLAAEDARQKASHERADAIEEMMSASTARGRDYWADRIAYLDRLIATYQQISRLIEGA